MGDPLTINICENLPVGAKRKSRHRGPACPVGPGDRTWVAPVDGTGVICGQKIF